MVGGEVVSKYVRSVGKYVKYRVNFIIDDSVVWGFNIGVGGGFCRVVDGEVNISKVYFVWNLMVLWV